MGFSNFKDKSGGRDAIQSNKSDATLNQIGGEGGGKEGKIPSGNSDLAFHPHKNHDASYSGQGRDLKKEDF